MSTVFDAENLPSQAEMQALKAVDVLTAGKFVWELVEPTNSVREKSARAIMSADVAEKVSVELKDMGVKALVARRGNDHLVIIPASAFPAIERLDPLTTPQLWAAKEELETAKPIRVFTSGDTEEIQRVHNALSISADVRLTDKSTHNVYTLTLPEADHHKFIVKQAPLIEPTPYAVIQERAKSVAAGQAPQTQVQSQAPSGDAGNHCVLGHVPADRLRTRSQQNVMLQPDPPDLSPPLNTVNHCVLGAVPQVPSRPPSRQNSSLQPTPKP
jgi:hypothetical protein